MSRYSGTITTTGKSEAIRLEKALFKSHPEFAQRAKVEAHVIAPGTMLVSVGARAGGHDGQFKNKSIILPHDNSRKLQTN